MYLVIFPLILHLLPIVVAFNPQVVHNHFGSLRPGLLIFRFVNSVGARSRLRDVFAVPLDYVRINSSCILHCGGEWGVLKETVLDGVYLGESFILGPARK